MKAELARLRVKVNIEELNEENAALRTRCAELENLMRLVAPALNAALCYASA